jgi:hypothetical protein
MSLGNLVYLALMSLFGGGILNQWILKKKFNGNTCKVVAIFMVMFVIILGYLLQVAPTMCKEWVIIGMNTMIPMALGVFLDERLVDKWINGYKK